MINARRALALTAAALLAAQPCAAQSHFAGSNEERRMSAFAGLNVRMPLGDGRSARPSARLQLTTRHDVLDARTGSVRTFQAQGLEMGAAANGAPTFHINGRSTARLREDLRLSGSTSDTVWIIFGVTLVAVAVLVLSSSSDLPGPPI